ncbi:hypothetical protein GKA01_02730 [Gluconobacter kanchanaburiensis NBRC 103587]|uniref:Uncharacterized protein n=1 Tax=Gluconobacter kanchanaburiensis NBRC 103587 TaxID=1307948 RepID=A0A511B3R7_9PROT|nr:hypothetical protein AA103587_1481 [Gluconobacter kanchanaburiensis NBRC 103587]GEK95076.1 hypothetical protein GKA01_02730 [Gluconobacter kanchanaburiensis NBRC 103587]
MIGFGGSDAKGQGCQPGRGGGMQKTGSHGSDIAPKGAFGKSELGTKTFHSGLRLYFGRGLHGFRATGKEFNKRWRGLWIRKPRRKFMFHREKDGGMHEESGFDGQALDGPTVVGHA